MKMGVGIGYRVGLLVVTALTGRRKAGYIVWKCRCECGKDIELDTRTLQRGTIRDCGCRTMVKPGKKNISGQRFGRLTAISPVQKQQEGSSVWRCRCDCGNEIDVPLHQLTAGYRKSCGCLRYITPDGEKILKDYVGKRFGMLTVISYWGKENGMHRWLCRCDCGKETVVGQTLLQSGKTKSCGCLQSTRIDGREYIGYLEMPTINIEIPVLSEWSYDNLQVAPCLYCGNISEGMVLLAHNYDAHFGRIKDLGTGDPVQFVGADGRIVQYEVDGSEIIAPKNVQAMIDNPYGLTLFTCTKGGANRLAVRLNEVQQYAS